MRPHLRVVPLVIAILASMVAAASIPVDANERRCREAPEAQGCDRPAWQPWMLRLATQGY